MTEGPPFPPVAETPNRKRTSTWQVVLYQATVHDECWCGKARGHAGWLVCAEREATRLDAYLDDPEGTDV